ncbi:hypothetical protein GF343_04775 [Candidatus Woesearchaeota archaeon]|nr:hypothetical protein [Candidatus Woesearchaeota archaeon]
MATTHLFACMQGRNTGELLEVELNDKPLTIHCESTVLARDGRTLAVKMQGRKKTAILDELNESFTSPFGKYGLIRSDLFKPDFRKNKKLKGLETILPRKIPAAAVEAVRSQLTETQKAVIGNTSATLEKYIAEYMKNPIEMIARQNKVISSIWNTLPNKIISNGKNIDDEINEYKTILNAELKPDTQHFKELVMLNALIERKIYSKNRNQPKTHENTTELKSVEYLIENDYIPSTGSAIGQTEYEDGKGNLVVHKTSPAMLEVLAEARITAANPKHDALKTALKVYRAVHDAFPDKKAFAGRGSNTMPLNPSKEGVCINKAIVLQLALQEAGIKSRYVRGRTAAGISNHAWVEADVLEPGRYALILDPHFDGGTVFAKGQAHGDFFYRHAARENGKIKNLNYFNVVWRSK